MIHLPVNVRRGFRITTFGYGRVQLVALLDDLGHLLAQPFVREHSRDVSCNTQLNGMGTILLGALNGCTSAAMYFFRLVLY